jgi:hypothetical protein
MVRGEAEAGEDLAVTFQVTVETAEAVETTVQVAVAVVNLVLQPTALAAQASKD